MGSSHTRLEEILISGPQIDQTFPFYHHILEREYYMKKKLLSNALNTLILTKLKNLYRKFFGGFIGKVGWKEDQRSGGNIRKI